MQQASREFRCGDGRTVLAAVLVGRRSQGHWGRTVAVPGRIQTRDDGRIGH